MKINFKQVLTSLTGEPLKERNVKDGKETGVTLGTVCANALLMEILQENGRPEMITGEEKIKRFRLAERIYGHENVDLNVEDIAKIKELVSKSYSVLVVGRVWNLLEKD